MGTYILTADQYFETWNMDTEVAQIYATQVKSFVLRLTLCFDCIWTLFWRKQGNILGKFGFLRHVHLGLIQLCCCLNSSQTVRVNELPKLTCQEIVGIMLAFNSTQKGEKQVKRVALRNKGLTSLAAGSPKFKEVN